LRDRIFRLLPSEQTTYQCGFARLFAPISAESETEQRNSLEISRLVWKIHNWSFRKQAHSFRFFRTDLTERGARAYGIFTRLFEGLHLNAQVARLLRFGVSSKVVEIET
jgi:hypothetical protein